MVCRWFHVEGQSHYGSSRRGVYIVISGLFKRIASIPLLRLVQSVNQFSYVVDRGGNQQGLIHPTVYQGASSLCSSPVVGLTD